MNLLTNLMYFFFFFFLASRLERSYGYKKLQIMGQNVRMVIQLYPNMNVFCGENLKALLQLLRGKLLSKCMCKE